MTILFNTFRNCLFAPLVAGLAMTNVTFAGQGNKGGNKNFKSSGGNKGAAMKSFSAPKKSFSAPAKNFSAPKKSFSAPKMIAKTPIMKSGGKSNFSNKQFGKTQTFKSTPTLGKL